METLLTVLIILVCFNFMLKQTHRHLRSVVLIAIVAALFTGLSWPYAIEQSKTQIIDWLADAQLMLDLSVILSLEVVMHIAYCLMAVHVMTSDSLRRRTIWLYRLLRWFPGVMIFPVLFSLLVSLIFAFPGKSFPLIAWSLAATVLVIIPLGSWLLRCLLPEKELRLEIFFLTNALVAILGIIATVNGRTAVAGISSVDWTALLAVLVLVLLGGLIGFLRYKGDGHKRQKCRDKSKSNSNS